MITQEEIRQNLINAIENSGMKKKDIAEKVKVKPTQISSYIHKKKMPSLETLANLCIVIDVSADEILGIKKN